MRRVILRLFGSLIFVVMLIVAVASVFGTDPLLKAVFGPVERTPVVFAKLTPTDRPNQFLVCPENFCAASPDRTSPVYQIPVSVLQKSWQRMIAGQPRVALLGTSASGLQADYVQKSAIIGFSDTITIRFIRLDDARSTFAIYSRSHYGHSDLGVNRERIEAWLSALNIPK